MTGDDRLIPDLRPHVAEIARALLGEPNKALSSSRQLRFGTNGSVAVEIAGEKRGEWFDHEAGVGGGPWELVTVKGRMAKGDAIGWIRSRLGIDLAPKQRASRQIAATYDYHDERGGLLFQVCRFEPKDFRQRRPDDKGGWDWRVRGLQRVPYRLPELLAAPSDCIVFIVEGEKDADRLANCGLVATCNPGGAGKWQSGFNAFFQDRDVVILPDNDDAGRDHARSVAINLAPRAARVRILELAGLPPKGDVSDWLNAGGSPEALQRLAADAPVFSLDDGAEGAADQRNTPDDKAEIARLAALPLIEYGRERKAGAQRLGCPVAILDKAVAAERASSGTVIGQGRPLDLPEPEPWPEPVDGAELLSAITNAVSRFMVMEKGMAECVALWALHTHALDAFGITPRLAITSPRPQCGKTTLLDILQRLVTRALLAVSVSAASVFRVVEVACPTLLVDEADTFLPGNDELRGVLNSGHRRGGNVIRVVGDAMQVCQFSTFAPAAIAMIGRLPGTLADRSILIALKRKRADEQVESFRHDRTQDLDRLARMCARWAADNIEQLRQADPAVPANLYNRAADNWRPLLAIADAAGDDWPGKAREIAAVTVHADQAKRVGLLADIREVFAERNTDRIKSEDLAAVLVAMEGHPWAEHGKTGKPLSANSLARMLADDDILPKTVRFGDGQKDTHKGYMRAQFEDAFARYLPASPIPTVTPSQPSDFCGSPVGSQPSQGDPVLRLEIGQNPRVSAVCDDVTVENQGTPKSTRVRMRL